MNRPAVAQQHPAGSTARPALPAREAAIPQWVAEVYEAANAAERSALIAQLMRPLGLLSLVAVADGVFAKIRLRSGWQQLNIRLEDLHHVRAAHVVALVEHAQEVNVEAVDGLAQLLAAWPRLSGSAAAMLLVSALVQRASARANSSDLMESDLLPSPPPPLLAAANEDAWRRSI